MRGPTLNHEPNIGRPYASRDRYHELLPVPYGDAGGTHEQLTAAPQISEDDVHAEHNQERRSGKGQVPKELKMERRQNKSTDRGSFLGPSTTGGGGAYSRIGKCSGPKNVACQNAGAYEIDNGPNVHCNCIGL